MPPRAGRCHSVTGDRRDAVGEAGWRVEGHRLVFVGGVHRSGTTAVARLLAGHPQVSGFSATGQKEDEGQHLQDVYPSARAYGGAGRFAFRPEAHLTEDSPLATPANAARLFDQWSRHWDLSRPVLVEKSPPNVVMTRFLQALYPEARLLVVVRHPVVVALSTRKWAQLTPLRRLIGHWLRAYETFLADAAHLRRVHVVRYEHLVAAPERVLGEVGAFLELDGPVPTGRLERHRSDVYERRWADLRGSRLPWRRRPLHRIEAELGPRVARFGYDLTDLARVGPFPALRPAPPGAGPAGTAS